MTLMIACLESVEVFLGIHTIQSAIKPLVQLLQIQIQFLGPHFNAWIFPRFTTCMYIFHPRNLKIFVVEKISLLSYPEVNLELNTNAFVERV
jgi:hypothetical protein